MGNELGVEVDCFFFNLLIEVVNILMIFLFFFIIFWNLDFEIIFDLIIIFI